jgi:hypothetical protein
MGSSATVSSYPDLFSTADKKQKIYNKKITANRLPYDFGQIYHPFEKEQALPDRTLKPRDDALPELVPLSTHMFCQNSDRAQTLLASNHEDDRFIGKRDAFAS